MFDNLKDKLGSFRDDAEEAAEENVEEVDEDDLDAAELEDAEADVDSTDSSDATPSDSADAADAEAVDTTVDAETATPASAAVEPDAAVTAESEPEPTTEAATADAAESAGQEPATDPDLEVDDAGSAPDESVSDEEPAADEDEEATADDEDEDDDGGRTGLGARARSLFSGSSDDAESDADETGSDDEPVDAATPDEAAAETATVDDPAAETAVDEGPVAEDADETPDEADIDEDDATADNGGTGFGAKAKSLVKGKFVIEEEDLEGPLHELEMALLSSDVEMGVAEEILDNIRDELVGETRTFTTSTGEVVEEALHNAIYDVISVGQFDFDERIAEADKPVTIVFTGVNGVGKTTSIAKLSRYFEERGFSTVMANGDTYRAGANEQIQEHADALETKLISHEQGGDPAAVLYDAVEYAEANDVDVVLGDTAGRLHTDEGLMDQLEKIDRVVGPDMTLFVDEAVAGQDAVNRAREFNDAAEIDGAILTKADADSNGGAAISIAHVTGKPILFLGVGQGYDDLEQFDPDEMLDRLLEDEA
ncbi:cell division protein FtsY [Natrinema pellirubrum DSM 15624]|uniref:Signal recognition particle receptor FtsY n=1 Tax=Natrinema pellirubrum (strain DSM 15624 / CIP 106293 / JCM 10476 / NCIMB 786 / 157) TaxID=797303 RepID=L0JS81_NATP1|nr:signal recognition particle-docking protein FtsY [Natrinema pellirubrum]AGB33497.1 signal recognition particle-docking protein FtsY [Natrinema pellirubrum DSM 15624]ELY70728.1 cell division protein FtsY [Natrinema pellirubrum DSM 15624]